MDPFHVVRLAGEALDRCRRRVQQQLNGHRGRKGSALYALVEHCTGADFLTDKQVIRVWKLFTSDWHVAVEAAWAIYQRIVAAYREPDEPDRGKGRLLRRR